MTWETLSGRSALLRVSRIRGTLGTVSAIGAALIVLLAAFAIGNYSADAHPVVHPQKKLFNGRWYKPLADLTTSPPWFGVPGFPNAQCDGGYDTASCVSKWQGPAYSSYADWNSQPSTARFNVQGYRDHNWDNNTYVVDSFQGAPPGLLGFAAFYDYSGNQCAPHPYPGELYCSVYRHSDAIIIDDNHSGVFSTARSRQATITHELGHVLSLRHESVNDDESALYGCGQDNTGPIPPSVMAYYCIYPSGYPYYGAGMYTVQEWDTCGVNHAYPDAVYGWEECVCYPPPGGGPAPAEAPAYFHPVTPVRILDTRFGPGPTGKVGENCVISVQVAGVGGVPASGVSAVVLNATVTAPTSGSYMTLYPSGSSLPFASNLNFSSGQTVPNLVTVKVGADGKVNVYNNKGTTHVVLDVAGWYDSVPGALPNPGASTMGIDMNTTGNTSSAIASIQQCARIDENGVQDGAETGVDTLTVDITAQGVPAHTDGGTPSDPADDTGGIIGYQFDISYPSATFTVQSSQASSGPSPDGTFLVNRNAGSGVSNFSDPVPDDNAGNTWSGSGLDIGSSAPESGDGVMHRVTISTEAGAAAGQYPITLVDNSHLDAAGTPHPPTTTTIANIAVNQVCGSLVTPTPAPSPSPTPTPGGSGYYHPVPPARILDTRPGEPAPGPKGKVGPGGTITVDVTGIGGVPASGVSAVVLNTTVTEPSANSYLTVFPSGASMPLASNLNFQTGVTIPNLVIVKVGGDGKVNVFNAQGSTHVIFDVAGWFGGFGSDGTLFRSLTPTRILDTRTGPQGVPAGKVDPGETITVDVTVGAVPSGASAVILNVTATEPTSNSFLTVFPSGAGLPLASNLNFSAGVTVPNLVIVKVGTDGNVRVYNKVGSVHVIFDVAGWYGGP